VVRLQRLLQHSCVIVVSLLVSLPIRKI
jgi:hypothetical protein